MVQGMDAFGGRGGEHVRQVLAQEQTDFITRGAVPLNQNHRYKFTRCARPRRCAKIPMIVTRPQEVRPMNAVSAMGAPRSPRSSG